jgi:hypothetical protein
MNLSNIDIPFVTVILVAIIFIIIFVRKLMPYYFTKDGRKKLHKSNEKDMTLLFIGVLELTLIVIVLLGIFLSIKPFLNLFYAYNLSLFFIIVLVLIYAVIIYLLYLLVKRLDKKWGKV